MRNLAERFLSVRQQTESICSPLETEDYVVQPISDVSPPKWHLAHTSWFFEELLLKRHLPDYQRFNEQYPLLFNSYYKLAGEHWIQGERGQLSRPTVSEVYAYRKHVDENIIELLQNHEISSELNELFILGLHHEQQHQELLYMDLKYILGINPIATNYSGLPLLKAIQVEKQWRATEEGLYQIGHEGEGFAFDNEMPRHKAYLHSHEVADAYVTNGEYLNFLNSKDYNNSKIWLSLGWDWKNNNNIEKPLYWRKDDNNNWLEFTLHGWQPLDPDKPVAHISYFEADAYATWAECRLPTEFEAEHFLKTTASRVGDTGKLLHANDANQTARQLWFWTSSHYSPYPGFRPFAGLVEEYNGKFMCQQFVLKGGCFATPINHFRQSYRNFFFPGQRWMFSGIRLSRDVA